MAIDVALIGRVIVELDVTAFDRDDAPVTDVTEVDVGIGPVAGDSTSVETWQTVAVSGMVGTLGLIGFYCPVTTGSGVKIILPARPVYLWMRLTDDPEILPVMVDLIRPV